MDLQVCRSADIHGDELRLPPEKVQWFRDAKIGLFIHYGLYSLTEGGEWSMFLDPVDVDEYALRADEFTGEQFDAAELARLAKMLGAKYSYMTTRHHDGFCLYDSACSDFNSVRTAARRDFIREYLDAFRAEDIRAGLYYSPMDWRFPGYFFPRMYHRSALAMKKQGYAQIEELCSRYGEIPLLWYDGGWLAHGGLHFSMKTGWYGREPGTPGDQGQWLWEPLKLNTRVRELQPDVLLNPRSGWQGDFDTYEAANFYRFLDENRIVSDKPWEGCDALNDWWSYAPGVADGKDFDHWIRTLSRTICRDGVLVMNIGPRADGSLDSDHVRIFEKTGAWVHAHAEGIYGTRAGPFAPGDWGGSVHAGDCVYLHILEWPADELILPPVEQQFQTAEILLDETPVEFVQDERGLRLKHPGTVEPEVTVVRLR